MEKVHLTIVGSGSAYTLGMVMSLIEEKQTFPLQQLTFYDIDEQKQAKTAKAIEIILKEKYPELEAFQYTTNKQKAFQDADMIFIQIRTGGLAMREKDEEISLRHGVVGQETCGAGGMAYGLRSITDMVQLITDIRSLNPDAWILNYTNPAAIVAEALNRVFPSEHRLLNICDMPISIMISYAEILNMEVWDLVPEYFGLNHFGWFTGIFDKQGNDHTETLKITIINEGFEPASQEIANDTSWQQTFAQVRDMVVDFPDYLPNTYLQYYLYPDKMVQKEDPAYTRAQQVQQGRMKDVFAAYERIIANHSTSSEQLSVDVHGLFIIRAAASLFYNQHQRFIVMVENQGVVANLPDTAMVEVPALLTNQGPKPFAVGKIPTFYKGILENQLAYEQLVVDAYDQNNYHKLLQALTLNRTVVDVSTAKDLLDELIEANKDYWPVLYRQQGDG